MKKQMLCLLLTLCMVLTLMPVSVSAAGLIHRGDSGRCGENVIWTLGSDGLLTIRSNKHWK